MQTEGPNGKVNMKLKLPGSQWFSQLVQEHVPDWTGKVSAWTDRNTRRHSETDVRVLVNVQAGLEYSGPLTAWSKEEAYLHEYLQQASDAFSLRCTSLCMFQGCLTVSCPQRLSRPMWCPGPIDLQHFCNAAGQRAEDICAHLRVTEAELTEFLAAPVCMQIHALFLTLMQKGAWNSVDSGISSFPAAGTAVESSRRQGWQGLPNILCFSRQNMLRNCLEICCAGRLCFFQSCQKMSERRRNYC